MNKNKGLQLATLAASIALAMSATSAMAATPTALQLPGHGLVSGSGTVTASLGTGDAAGTMDVTVSGAAVINWGKGTGDEGNGNLNSTGVAGFNIGSDAAVTFTGGSPTTDGVLNIDSSGNASQIFGSLVSNGASVYVANANGIIVGEGATISGTGTVGLIANTLSSTAATDFDPAAGTGAVEYSGTGGDVTVQPGANLDTTILVSGGGDVNVDLGSLTGALGLSAGVSSSSAGGFANDNADATLTVSGDQGAGSISTFASAGDASSSGTLTLTSADVAGTFTNTGTLNLGDGFAIDGGLVNETTVNAAGATFGSVTNDGQFTASGAVETTDGGITNKGQLSASAITAGGGLANTGEVDAGVVAVTGGDLVNGGIFNGTGTVTVTGGNLTNSGTLTGTGTANVNEGSLSNSGIMTGFDTVSTSSDSSADDFTAGADYSINNTGKMVFAGGLTANANAGANRVGDTDNDSTGSFTNTGTLQVGAVGGLDISAQDDLSLGGILNAGTKAVSIANPLGTLTLTATDGMLTMSAPVVFAGATANLTGAQVSLTNDLLGVDEAGDPAGTVKVLAGAAVDGGYAVRVASGKTVSADKITVQGDADGDNPNVILQGTLSGNTVSLGAGTSGLVTVPVSDVFSGPAGGIVATNMVTIAFNGAIKTAKYLNDSNFRFNYLPITAAGDAPLILALKPVSFKTNGTSNGLSAVNVLVNGDVVLQAPSYVDTTIIDGAGSAVTGVIDYPNTHLVLQSTGNISTEEGSTFYWPGYVYLGNINANADGSPAPGTLGFGTITLGGDFSNVLPGNVGGAGGIHFITQMPLSIAGNVTTNANSWVNFGTDLLTQGYASGTLGGSFFGGVQGDGTVVNYGELDTSMFHTHPPVSTR